MLVSPGMRLVMLVVLAVPQLAHADDHCTAADADLAWSTTDVVDLSGDTGWFPASSPAQVRLTGAIASDTAVATGVKTTACWTGDKMSAALAGNPGSGWLDVAYGAQVHAYAKIDTSILGKAIYWEGEIPLHFLPSDLMIAGTSTFDPGGPAQVSDQTDPVTVLSTDLIGDLIGIVGISGGLRIAVTGSMVTSYSDRIAHLGNASGTGALPIDRPSGGYGAALDLPISFDGVVHYAPALSFGVRFDVKILGIRVVDYELFAVPMSLPPIDRQVSLTGDNVHLGLPVLAGIGEGARIDFADAPTQSLTIRNAGEHPLELAVAHAPAGVTAAPLTIAPGGTAQLQVTAVPEKLPATLSLTTNDPDHPTLDIALGVDVGGTDPGMIEEPQEGGCNSGGATGWAGLVLVLVGWRLRRALGPCTRR